MPALSDLEQGLHIDPNALDTALAQHPDLFHRVASRLANTISVRDAAKKAVSDIEARVYLAIRQEAENNEEKLTEAMANARLTRNRNVDEAREYLLELNKQVGELNAMKEAYQSRSYALTGLVDLYVSGYFADRSDGHRTRTLRDDHNEQARSMLQTARRERMGSRNE